MPSQTLTPSMVASILGVNVQTVRRWAAAHAAHLSPDANRTPRKLTGRDVEVLKHVASLRAQGLQESAINARLATLTFVEVDSPSSVEESESNSRENGSQRAVVAPQLPAFVVEAVNQRVAAVERQIERVERNQRDRAMLFVAGVAVGLVAGILLLLAAYLLATIGP